MNEAENVIERIDKKLDRLHRKTIIWKQALEFCANHASYTNPSVIQDVARKALAYKEN